MNKEQENVKIFRKLVKIRGSMASYEREEIIFFLIFPSNYQDTFRHLGIKIKNDRFCHGKSLADLQMKQGGGASPHTSRTLSTPPHFHKGQRHIHFLHFVISGNVGEKAPPLEKFLDPLVASLNSSKINKLYKICLTWTFFFRQFGRREEK